MKYVYRNRCPGLLGYARCELLTQHHQFYVYSHMFHTSSSLIMSATYLSQQTFNHSVCMSHKAEPCFPRCYTAACFCIVLSLLLYQHLAVSCEFECFFKYVFVLMKCCESPAVPGRVVSSGTGCVKPAQITSVVPLPN